MRLWIVLIVGTLSLCSGCTLTADKPGPESPPPTAETTAEASAEASAEITPESTVIMPPDGAIGPVVFPLDVNPLTGTLVEDPAVLERRPIVVKISNAPPLVRPQSGISEADLVFEHYAEGGVTRFSAIFYSRTPARVGSIRSARLIDYELVPMYQGLLVFSGASLGVYKRIYGSDYVQDLLCSDKEEPEKPACLAEADAIAPPGLIPPSEFADRAFRGIDYGPQYYWRDETIPIPHNFFANLEAIWSLAAERGLNQRPELSGLAFHPDPAVNAAAQSGPAAQVDIRYRATRLLWQYDPDSGLYRRFSDGQGHFDANTGTQITAANVVIIYAGHYLTDIVESVWQNGVSYSEQITIWPEGDAILIRDGQRFDGRWVRAVREDRISLYTNDGQSLYLKPGSTWFQLVRLPEQMNPAEEWVQVN